MSTLRRLLKVGISKKGRRVLLVVFTIASAIVSATSGRQAVTGVLSSILKVLSEPSDLEP